MPCRDYESSGPYAVHVVDTKQVDRLARIACELATHIETRGKFVDRNPLFSKETQDWWRKHKEADARHEAEKAKKKRLNAIKEKAISKLTTEERKVLGL